MKYRAGEEAKTFFRTERKYFSNGEWFFSTRDGTDIGPFSCQEDAEAELMMYIRHCHGGSVFASAVAQQNTTRRCLPA